MPSDLEGPQRSESEDSDESVEITLSNEVYDLLMKYDEVKDPNIEILDQAIAKCRQVLSLPSDRLRRPNAGNMGKALSLRFDRLGTRRDLSEAIVWHREVVSLGQMGDEDQWIDLNNLGLNLMRRYRLVQDSQDLQESIQCHRGAVELCDDGHPWRSNVLGNLATALWSQYVSHGDIAVLEEAIRYHREVASLATGDHRARCLTNLAISLLGHFRRSDDPKFEDEAIAMYREALTVHPQDHTAMHNFATALTERYDRTEEAGLLDEIIRLREESTLLCPSGSSFRAAYLLALAGSLDRELARSDKFLAQYAHFAPSAR